MRGCAPYLNSAGYFIGGPFGVICTYNEPGIIILNIGNDLNPSITMLDWQVQQADAAGVDCGSK